MTNETWKRNTFVSCITTVQVPWNVDFGLKDQLKRKGKDWRSFAAAVLEPHVSPIGIVSIPGGFVTRRRRSVHLGVQAYLKILAPHHLRGPAPLACTQPMGVYLPMLVSKKLEVAVTVTVAMPDTDARLSIAVTMAIPSVTLMVATN